MMCPHDIFFFTVPLLNLCDRLYVQFGEHTEMSSTCDIMILFLPQFCLFDHRAHWYVQ